MAQQIIEGQANHNSMNSRSATAAKSKGGLTMTILGCGNLATAILAGIFTSLQESSHSTEDFPPRIPTKFIACVTRPASAKRIEKELSHLTSCLRILQNENVRAVQEADIVLLGCKPYNYHIALEEKGMQEALSGKLLMSMVAGVTNERLESIIYKPGATTQQKATDCKIVRVMPNTAALIRESMTVISPSPSTPLSQESTDLVTWIFSRVGKVLVLPAQHMDTSSALAGSGPALFALMLEAAADGAVAMGVPRAEAELMAAQTMKGAAGLVLSGERPPALREKVSTPGGCTMAGLLVLEEGAVRGTIAKSIREATCVAGLLGKGVKGVNGTRRID